MLFSTKHHYRHHHHKFLRTNGDAMNIVE